MNDGYHSVSEPVFIGNFPIRTELEVTPDPNFKGWIVEECVSVDGNLYLKLLSKYLKKVGKSSEDDLSEDEIEDLLDQASYKKDFKDFCRKVFDKFTKE